MPRSDRLRRTTSLREVASGRDVGFALGRSVQGAVDKRRSGGHLSRPMVSNTQQFERIRKRKATTNGKRNKRERRKLGTPKFPVHPTGYDVKAPDAKKST